LHKAPLSELTITSRARCSRKGAREQPSWTAEDRCSLIWDPFRLLRRKGRAHAEPSCRPQKTYVDWTRLIGLARSFPGAARHRLCSRAQIGSHPPYQSTGKGRRLALPREPEPKPHAASRNSQPGSDCCLMPLRRRVLSEGAQYTLEDEMTLESNWDITCAFKNSRSLQSSNPLV
jgi:hypothetical protein